MNRPRAIATAITCALLFAATANAATTLKYAIKDNSPETLIKADAVKAIWTEALPEKAPANFPIKKFGYVSEVNGGFDANKNCVVVARAMVVPLSLTKAFIYDPKKTSVAFATQANATTEQCSALAAGKLKEAVASVVSSLAN